MKVLQVLAFAIIAAAGSAELAWANGQKQVLVLYSTRRDAQVAVVGDRDLPRILDQGLPEGIDYYSEYIDLARSPDPAYQAGFRDFLQVKYKGVRFDLVIAVMDEALKFATQNRDELFPGTPIVFLSTNSTSPRVPNGTGILAGLDLMGTLELALALQPDTQHVFVVTGAGGTDKGYENLARAQLRPIGTTVDITFLAGLSMHALKTRLETLPEHAIVYFLIIYRDADGLNFHPLESLDLVVQESNAPVYCWVDSAMDHGIVGGSLKDQILQTEEIGRLALKVLRGTPAGSIPVSSPSLHVRQVDWRQLRRWGISESRVPPGTLVKFREPSVWDRYRSYILAAVSIVLAQTVLIAGLLVQRRRRRQAEAAVRGQQAELHTSYGRIRDLGSRLLNAQESERARIARELHDDINQQMALLQIDLQLLSSSVEGGAVEMAGEALTKAQGVARSVHDLSHRLHPAKLRLIGLVSALKGLQRELSQSGLEIRFTHDDIPAHLPAELTLCLFRVAQESLQNVAKHGGTDQVAVHLGYDGKALSLTIVDDGVGFEVTKGWGRGLGLISIHERLEAIGGALEVDSKPGAGTRIEVSVPLPAQTESAPIPEDLVG